MGGSQIKQLKEALKENGLIGQTNVRRKNKKSKTPSETRRNDKEEVLNKIRKLFNQFDNKFNRSKHDVSIVQGGKFVKVGSKQHNAVSKTHSNMEKNMRLEYETYKKVKGRTGGLVDRRFGEKSSGLSAEEKMLERFTKERQTASKRKVDYSLASDHEEDDDDGLVLTHGGKALSLDDEFDDGDLGVSQTKYYDDDQLDAEQEPPKKKSKAEVMKEVIAKSKFHKHQRQVQQQKTQEDIMDLDDQFGDVMTEFQQVSTQKAPAFLNKTPEEIQYDLKVKELTYDRRAAPADPTKTEEQIKKEYDDKMKKLEEARLRRMEGDDDNRDAEGDDLDDFWQGSDEDADGIAISNDEEPASSDEGHESEDDNEQRQRPRKRAAVTMPTTHAEFEEILASVETSKHKDHVNKIIEIYHPRLAEGNKSKMDNFVGILFEHVLYSVESKEISNEQLSALLNIVKKLSETYNEKLVEVVRAEINTIQERISDLKKRDLVFFTIIGYLFSTSDHYHLIVTPTLLLMNESLSSVVYDRDTNIGQIGKGVYICDVLLKYQRLSKRFIPEVVCFLEKALLLLIPESKKLLYDSLSVSDIIDNKVAGRKMVKFESGPLKISDLFDSKSTELASNLLFKILSTLDVLIGTWRDKSASIEFIGSFIPVLDHLASYCDDDILTQVTTKCKKLVNNAIRERRPLTLQYHRALAIPTYAPKFEENFNPDKKSYDVNRERQEMNKIRNEIKKEKKGALKDIRRQTKFTAREQIKEKKASYDEYHRKMANIVNSISTIEGAEKNSYDREKQKRKRN